MCNVLRGAQNFCCTKIWVTHSRTRKSEVKFWISNQESNKIIGKTKHEIEKAQFLKKVVKLLWEIIVISNIQTILNIYLSFAQCVTFCGAPKTFDAQKFESHTAEQKLSKGSVIVADFTTCWLVIVCFLEES